MSLTPKCPRCNSQGMCACQSNYKTIHELALNQTAEERIRNVKLGLKYSIEDLPRYDCISNSGGQDCWVTMEADKNGEWIKITDVLALFSEKKE